MKYTKECVQLIKKWEGLYRKRADGLIEAYRDPVGIWTIGYGSINHMDLGRPIQPGDTITEATAERWLELEVEEAADDLNLLCQVPLTQGMFDALVSFIYNIGVGAFGESTLLKKLNRSDYEGTAREFDRWVHGTDNGFRRVLPGLVNRRNDEEALFRRDGLTPSTTRIFAAAPSPVPGSTPLVEELPYQAAPVPLPIKRSLQQGDIGEDCHLLNCAMAGLGMLRMAPQPNGFTAVTRSAVELFQRREALSRIDGIVGPETRRAIENSLRWARMTVPSVTPDKGVYCRLIRTHAKTYKELELCKLQFVDPKLGIVESLDVVSGLPGAQRFLLWSDPDSFVGSHQPIPQGRYYIGDIDWAGGKDNYDKSHTEPGIGPVWVPLIKQQPDDRDAFGFHADWNWITERTSPGSAGCVCPATKPDLKELVRLLRQYDPRLLVVDWGL